jgi:hypothetical protein
MREAVTGLYGLLALYVMEVPAVDTEEKGTRVNIVLPKDVHQLMRIKTFQRGITVGEAITEAVAQWVEAEPD